MGSTKQSEAPNAGEAERSSKMHPVLPLHACIDVHVLNQGGTPGRAMLKMPRSKPGQSKAANAAESKR